MQLEKIVGEGTRHAWLQLTLRKLQIIIEPNYCQRPFVKSGIYNNNDIALLTVNMNHCSNKRISCRKDTFSQNILNFTKLFTEALNHSKYMYMKLVLNCSVSLQRVFPGCQATVLQSAFQPSKIDSL